MFQIHPEARMTPAVQADIPSSSELTSALSSRYESAVKPSTRGSDAC